MPRRAADNEAVRTAQRARLLDAAAHVFARKGFAAARVADVAKEAGVSNGLVHHYFSSKAALHRALVEQVMSSADALPRAALAREGTPWERLAWFVQTALLGAQHAPEQFFLVVEASMNEAVDPELRAHVATAGERGLNQLAVLIAEAQAAGTVRKGDPRALAEHLLATVQGLAVSQAGPRIDADIVLGLLRVPQEVIP